MNIKLKNLYIKLKCNTFIRNYSNNLNNNHLVLNKLKERSLLQIKGEDNTVLEFLQGLITNDIYHLNNNGSTKCIYTMFLNKPGRILYDSIIYKQSDANDNKTYLIECDKEVDVDLKKHLQFFRVRKKIDIDIATDYNVWIAFNPETNGVIDKIHNVNLKSENITLCTDPRVKSLGTRIIAPVSFDVTTIGKLIPSIKFTTQIDTNQYKEHRYKLGIGEGIHELPIAKSFPLEANCDYLHGISFHKGCYLGQEFTARTYHTGVIRKRLMPIELCESIEKPIDFPIHTTVNNNNKAIGKLRGSSNKWALALLNVESAIQSYGQLTIDNVNGKTLRPDWWPTEAPSQIPKES